jgi:hypothetical protein
MYLFPSFALSSGEEHTYSDVRFSTKHGVLSFVNLKGDTDVLAVEVKLDGQTLLMSANRTDFWGYPLYLMISDFATPYQESIKSKPTDKPLKIDRVVVSEGRNGTCINQFVILDFTGSRPFVSERFGYNPEGKSCLKFVRAKWGKKLSYIYLYGSEKYIYYTGGRVIGPVE